MATKSFFGLGARTFGNPTGRGGNDGVPGIAWTPRGTITPNAIIGLASDGTGTSWLTDNAGDVYSSTDGGVTWIGPVGSIAGWVPGGGSLAFGAGTLISQVNSGVSAARSINGGATWTVAPTGMTSAGQGYFSTNGAGTWIGFTNTVGVVNFALSVDDGLTWTNPDPVAGGTLFSPAIWTGTEFAGFGSDNTGAAPQLFTSPDGVAWALANAGNFFAAVCDSGALIAACPFGPSCSSAPTPEGVPGATPANLPGALGTPNCIIGQPTRYYVFDVAGGVANSDNALAWGLGASRLAPGEAVAKTAITFDPVSGNFIAGGSAGTVITST